MSTIDDVTKRERGPTILLYCNARERETLDRASEKAGVSRQVFILQAALAATGGSVMYVPEELARLVRAEARRLKVPPEHVLSSWILAHVGRGGEQG